MQYSKIQINKEVWVVVEEGKNYMMPSKTSTFAFDTETLVYLDGKVETQEVIFEKLKDASNDEKRKRLHNVVWAYQIYDEYNGFFMTNDFNTFLDYICKCGFKYGWCYNATFDFAQIDYQILSSQKDKWKPHVHEKGKVYNKAQKWTYESVHNDTGARYCYKLWVPYRQLKDRHEYVHSFELRDFMKLITGGLRNLLKDLEVTDNEGNPIRKLDMDYQNVDANNLTQAEIDYCCNDVKGLYFAVKKFNSTIEEQTNNELHIFGKDTNVITAGGLAKSELLRSLYPNLKDKRSRIKKYQKIHPVSKALDKYIRSNHLYRGGISLVNERYKGKMLTADAMKCKMYRYDVNSEYPFAMASIRDLVGAPIKMKYNEWLNYDAKEDYEAIYILKSVYGTLREGKVAVWYNPFARDFVKTIVEDEVHLMFEREFNEILNWYDLEFEIEDVILCKRGDYAYKDFVTKNYDIKATAKREGNKTLQQFAKLLLNSSYGKLAERIERRTGHYELNADTGAIHFVEDKVEEDEKVTMSVLVGSLVTSFARCYILSKIREVCGEDAVSKKFVYIDTDSIHAFADYDKADAYNLGGLKLEATCDAVKYIAPKTYIDIEELDTEGNVATYIKEGKTCYKLEVHSKGISTNAIMKDFYNKKILNVPYLDSKINYGEKYIVLCAMNVIGGKVLVPTEKYIARLELAPNEFYNNGYEGSYFNER